MDEPLLRAKIIDVKPDIKPGYNHVILDTFRPLLLEDVMHYQKGSTLEIYPNDMTHDPSGSNRVVINKPDGTTHEVRLWLYL